MILTGLEERGVSLGSHRDLVFFATIIGIGILFQLSIRLGLMAMGAFLGIALANFFLHFPFAVNLTSTTRLIIIIVSTVLFMIFAIILERPLLITSTSVV